MSLTAAAWVLVAAVLVIRSLQRPAWAIGLYFLTFFAAPHLWWWGEDLPRARYALWSGAALIASVVLYLARINDDDRHRFKLVHYAAIGFALNATFVHFFLATSPPVSLEDYTELLKFVLLFFLLWAGIRNKADFRIVLLAIALGAGYIGYEVTINERGDFNGARLEGVGAPGADTSNGLACLMLATLPLIGSLFIGGLKRDKLVVLATVPLALNVLILCNSRGAFLGLIVAGLTFFLLARGPSRKQALRVLMLGGVLLYFLLGDPEILERFATTFAGSEERDNSAAGRVLFWRAGVLMLIDYPFGAGGGAFKYVHASPYLAQVGSGEAPRSLHNGYLTDATDWGVQGLALKLLFVGAAVAAAHRTSKKCRLAGQADHALVGITLISAVVGDLVATVFGSFLNSEWVFWLAACLVRYSELYAVEEAPQSTVSPTMPVREPIGALT
jgi:putative inorganic carbon (HCO3(-)) transporter